MGAAALAALIYTRGDVGHLVVMYSINVFLTFSLSMLGMAHVCWSHRRAERRTGAPVALFAAGFCFASPSSRSR